MRFFLFRRRVETLETEGSGQAVETLRVGSVRENYLITVSANRCGDP